MPDTLPAVPENAPLYADAVSLIGSLRTALFESYGDRRFRDDRYSDLFLSMLERQLRGSVSTLEQMTAAIEGVSYSTKVRLIEDARKAGLIETLNRSEVSDAIMLETTSARKVFFLSDGAVRSMKSALDDIVNEVTTFSRSH